MSGWTRVLGFLLFRRYGVYVSYITLILLLGTDREIIRSSDINITYNRPFLFSKTIGFRSGTSIFELLRGKKN